MNVLEVGLKILASGCILGGSLGLGLCYKDKMQKQVRWLNELQRVLSLMESEIEYGREPLPELCKRLSERVPAQFQRGFSLVYQDYEENTGNTFERSFRDAFMDIFHCSPLAKEDRELFLSFLCGSIMDDKLLLERIRECKVRLRDREETINKEKAEKSRIALSLSGGLGITLILVLL